MSLKRAQEFGAPECHDKWCSGIHLQQNRLRGGADIKPRDGAVSRFSFSEDDVTNILAHKLGIQSGRLALCHFRPANAREVISSCPACAGQDASVGKPGRNRRYGFWFNTSVGRNAGETFHPAVRSEEALLTQKAAESLSSPMACSCARDDLRMDVIARSSGSMPAGQINFSWACYIASEVRRIRGREAKCRTVEGGPNLTTTKAMCGGRSGHHDRQGSKDPETSLKGVPLTAARCSKLRDVRAGAMLDTTRIPQLIR